MIPVLFSNHKLPFILAYAELCKANNVDEGVGATVLALLISAGFNLETIVDLEMLGNSMQTLVAKICDTDLTWHSQVISQVITKNDPRLG